METLTLYKTPAQHFQAKTIYRVKLEEGVWAWYGTKKRMTSTSIMAVEVNITKRTISRARMIARKYLEK